MNDRFLDSLATLVACDFVKRRPVRFLSVFIVTGSLCCAMTSFAIRTADDAHSAPRPANDETTSASRPPASPSPQQSVAQQPVRIQAEVIVIRRTGIEPATITRPKGRFLLLVANRSGLSEVGIRLDRVTGGQLRLREVRVPREKLDWRSVEDLNPGEYVLTEANHPGWACHITITPQ